MEVYVSLLSRRLATLAAERGCEVDRDKGDQGSVFTAERNRSVSAEASVVVLCSELQSTSETCSHLIWSAGEESRREWKMDTTPSAICVSFSYEYIGFESFHSISIWARLRLPYLARRRVYVGFPEQSSPETSLLSKTSLRIPNRSPYVGRGWRPRADRWRTRARATAVPARVCPQPPHLDLRFVLCNYGTFPLPDSVTIDRSNALERQVYGRSPTNTAPSYTHDSLVHQSPVRSQTPKRAELLNGIPAS